MARWWRRINVVLIGVSSACFIVAAITPNDVKGGCAHSPSDDLFVLSGTLLLIGPTWRLLKYLNDSGEALLVRWNGDPHQPTSQRDDIRTP